VLVIFGKSLEPFNEFGASTITNHYTGGTNHSFFDAAGIPVFQFIQDRIKYDTRIYYTNMIT
jgi:hypothetical protein